VWENWWRLGSLDLKEGPILRAGAERGSELLMTDRPTLTLEDDPKAVEGFVAGLQAAIDV
jgi:hypothetical protein